MPKPQDLKIGLAARRLYRTVSVFTFALELQCTRNNRLDRLSVNEEHMLSLNEESENLQKVLRFWSNFWRKKFGAEWQLWTVKRKSSSEILNPMKTSEHIEDATFEAVFRRDAQIKTMFKSRGIRAYVEMSSLDEARLAHWICSQIPSDSVWSCRIGFAQLLAIHRGQDIAPTLTLFKLFQFDKIY